MKFREIIHNKNKSYCQFLYLVGIKIPYRKEIKIQ